MTGLTFEGTRNVRDKPLSIISLPDISILSPGQSCHSNPAQLTQTITMASMLQIHPHPAIEAQSSPVLHAAWVPGTDALIAATAANELVHCSTRAALDGTATALAVARYATFAPDSLPEERALALVLLAGAGLRLHAVPGLAPVGSDLADQLRDMSAAAHTFSVDSLGSDLVGESFRVALALGETVSLLDICPARGKVAVLGEFTVPERVVAVAFSEMTIVASTAKAHFMLRISRGGGLAVAATVKRSKVVRRPSASVAVGDGSAAVLSFLGGLFAKRGVAASAPALALALPDNRWLLVVDQELVVYSSFGAKIEEMENVFRSKSGMDLPGAASPPRKADTTTVGRKRMSKTSSCSSFASHATGVTHKTYLDEALAARSEKPPADTVFSSPFVLSVTGDNQLVAYASNGSVPGVLAEISLFKEGEKVEKGVKITCARHDRVLAAAYWPSGRIVFVEMVNDLENLIEEQVTSEELRMALALVPADQVDRMIDLRRLLAKEARSQDWHDAAIYHMENVVNLSTKREGIDQVDLVAEAVEVRGPCGGGWDADIMIATMWADFLFRLRRRVMRPSSADIDVLETICCTDVSATRIKALLAVKHDIPLSTGESLITSPQCILREEERVEGLVALYTSLAEHGKALVLLENSNSTNSFDGVVGYLSSSMRASDNPDVYFSHLRWLAHHSREESQGRLKLQKVVEGIIQDTCESEILVGRLFQVLVEESEDMLFTVVNNILEEQANCKIEVKPTGQVKDQGETKEAALSADVLASALLTGMAKANALDEKELFDKLRSVFGARILYDGQSTYHSFTLLQCLQKAEIKCLGLHEELAFLLGRQGRHEAAADELAAEHALSPEEAIPRLAGMLPATDRGSAAEVLAAAYLRVSVQKRVMRVQDAAHVVRICAGALDVEKVLLDGRVGDDAMSLQDMLPFMAAGLAAGSERVRVAEILRALRKSEVRRLREEVLTRRKRFVVIGQERGCGLCARRIGDSAFAAYPDGSVAHLACHMSKDSHEGRETKE